jgi:hypothetical protein
MAVPGSAAVSVPGAAARVRAAAARHRHRVRQRLLNLRRRELVLGVEVRIVLEGRRRLVAAAARRFGRCAAGLILRDRWLLRKPLPLLRRGRTGDGEKRGSENCPGRNCGDKNCPGGTCPGECHGEAGKQRCLDPSSVHSLALPCLPPFTIS